MRTHRGSPGQGRCTMTEQTGLDMPASSLAGKPKRKRHRLRWVLAAAAALVVILVLAVGLFVKLQRSPAPLALPTAAAAAPSGPLAGAWHVTTGSMAGFRVRESAFGFSNDTVGRTSAVTGTVRVDGDRVVSGAFRIELTSVKVGGKSQPQFGKSLATSRYPVATVTLARSVALSPAFGRGATIRTEVPCRLAMHGVFRLVTFTISARRDGQSVQIAGSAPVAFTKWGVKGPANFGFIAGLASTGTAEFILVMHH
jgi:polyisoprenoid-binding protein YceI